MKLIKAKHLNNRKEGKAIREELLARVLNGEEINIAGSVEEFWSYNNTLEFNECTDQMKGYLIWLRWKLKVEYNEPFGSIDSQGTYRIPQNEDEFEVMAIRNLVRAKSTLENNVRLATKGKKQKWIVGPKIKSLPFSINSQTINPLNDKNGKNN